MISSILRSTPPLTSTVLYGVCSALLAVWMESNACSLVQSQVCAKPLSVFVASPAGSGAPVAGSYHLISNGPGLLPWSLTVFEWPGLPSSPAPLTTSEPAPNQRCRSFPTPSTAILNCEFAESDANMLFVMERVIKLFTAHTAAAALASGGSDHTISTGVPLAASIAGKNAEAVVDVPASSFRMSGLFSACSAIHDASWRQPS